jgi:hypothetical protein
MQRPMTPRTSTDSSLPRPSHRLVRGAAGGFVSTLAMSAVMIAAQRGGLVGRLPPRKVTEGFLRRHAGLRPSRKAAKLATAISHLAFGTLAGALFAAVFRRRRPPVRAAFLGTGFGSLVWGASYLGWVPALGLMPPPSRDRPDRQATLILAHWVYGVTLALIARPRSGWTSGPGALG